MTPEVITQPMILKTFLNQQTIFSAQVVQPTAVQPLAVAAPRLNGNGHGKAHGFPASAYHQPESRQGNCENDTLAQTREPAPAPPVNPSESTPAEPINPVRLGPASHIAMCLRQAIDAVIDAQEYGREKGFSVMFLGSDVRAIANSLMIGDQQRGGR